MKSPNTWMLMALSAQAVTTFAATSDIPANYFAYVSQETTPVCQKHHEKSRLCNLFVSCFPETFNTGKTGEKWCASTCDNFVKYFPRQMCKEHNWNQVQADKFDIDEANQQVCYTRPKQGTQCVSVESFVDIAGDDQGQTVGIRAAFVEIEEEKNCVEIMKKKYEFTDRGNGWFSLRTPGNSRVLDIAGCGNGCGKGTRVITWNYHGHGNQLWRIVEKEYKGQKSFILRPKSVPHMAMDISTRYGYERLTVHDYHGRSNQIFKAVTC